LYGSKLYLGRLEKPEERRRPGKEEIGRRGRSWVWVFLSYRDRSSAKYPEGAVVEEL
jgi:hypothetical protein